MKHPRMRTANLLLLVLRYFTIQILLFTCLQNYRILSAVSHRERHRGSAAAIYSSSNNCKLWGRGFGSSEWIKHFRMMMMWEGGEFISKTKVLEWVYYWKLIGKGHLTPPGPPEFIVGYYGEEWLDGVPSIGIGNYKLGIICGLAAD